VTKVSFDRAKLELRIEGHAGHAALGRDIVCAAESILLYTLLDWVQRREALMHPQVFLTEGNARIVCRPERKDTRRCREIMEAVFRGYELLAEGYPMCVEIKK